MTLAPIFLADIWGIVSGLVMGLFIVTGFLLMVVVLLQEGKGGGIAGAFGGVGAEAFGVKAGTVNRFTAYLGTAFLTLALVHAGIRSKIEQPTNPNQPSKIDPTSILAPVDDGAGTGPGGTPPSTPPATPPEPTPPVEPDQPPKEPATPPAPPPEPAPAPAPAPPGDQPPAMGG